MKIAIISDQHGTLPPIPECDLMIVSGDMCGGPDFIDGHWRPDLSNQKWLTWLKSDFMEWTRQAPFTILVGGNHDTCLEPDIRIEHERLRHLKDSSCEFGGLCFWGAPWIKQFDALAFNLPEHCLANKWADIPKADVLVLHGPPFGIGDRVFGNVSVGSPSLTDAIRRIKPKLVTCGHIHEGRGIYYFHETIVVNSACGFTEITL